MRRLRRHSRARKVMCSQKGETLVETLVSVLVSCLAMLMLANAIAAAFRIISTGRRSTDVHYAAETVLANPSAGNDGSVQVTRTKLGGDNVGLPDDVDVKYRNEEVAGGREATAYEYEGVTP